MATYLIGMRKERIQHIPDDLMPPGDPDQSNGTIMNIDVTEPSTSESSIYGNSKINNIINNHLDDSTSSDEDILPTENPNLIAI